MIYIHMLFSSIFLALAVVAVRTGYQLYTMSEHEKDLIRKDNGMYLDIETGRIVGGKDSNNPSI